MVRRILNTSEGVLEEIKEKLHSSGYRLEQIRKIILAGVKGYATKKRKCEKEGRSLRRARELGRELR